MHGHEVAERLALESTIRNPQRFFYNPPVVKFEKVLKQNLNERIATSRIPKKISPDYQARSSDYSPSPMNSLRH